MPKSIESIESIEPILYLILRVFLICSALYALVILVQFLVPASAKLQVGQCVKFNNPYKESWDQAYHYTEIILEIGKRNYKASFWVPEYRGRAGYWDSDTHSIAFNEADYYVVVLCPDKDGSTK